jgi:hypothetical protein
MGRWFELVARLTIAGLLAAGLLVVPGPTTRVAEARSPGCPSATSQRPPLDGSLNCYGSRILTFRAFVQRPCTDGCGGTTAYVLAPLWLDSMLGSSVELGTGPRSASITAFVPPAIGRCSAFADLKSCPFRPDHWATVKARFNDPIAQKCRYSYHPPGPGFTKKDAIAECRADLVVLSVVPAAPETDVAVAVPEDPAGEPVGLPLVAIFTVVLLVGVRRFPTRRRATGPDDGGRA